MRKLFGAVVVVLLVVGCSSKSAEEKSIDEALAPIIEDLDKTLEEITENGVTKTEVEAWPRRFCTLEIGMTRKEVQIKMGSSPTEYSGIGDRYEAWSYNLYIGYDLFETVSMTRSLGIKPPCADLD